MRATVRDITAEVRPTLALAGPVVLGQLGLMLMQLVDTWMVGELGSSAIASVGVGNAVSAVFFFFGLGTLTGLDRIVSFAWGAGRREECRRSLAQGLWVALGVGLVATVALREIAGHLEWFGYEPAIRAEAAAYLRVLALSIPPALAFTAVRQSLQATGDVRFATMLLLVANVVNLVGNQALVYGSWGMPALGVAGSAWATTISRVFLLVGLWLHAARKDMVGGGWAIWKPDLQRLGELLRLGVPAGVQLTFEGGVFALATLLAAQLGAAAGAAHQIVLQVASFTFMVPLGMSTAGAVRVGQALGRGDAPGARTAGWTAVTLGVAFMAVSGVTLMLLRGVIARVFQADAEVAALAGQLLATAAFFQLFDGAQVTLGGVLRGAANTMAPMVTNLVGHWAIGLPVGLVLCYGAGLGVLGLWIGLAAGLGSVAVALLVVWQRTTVRLLAGTPEARPEASTI